MVRQLPGFNRSKRNRQSGCFRKGALVILEDFGIDQRLNKAAVTVPIGAAPERSRTALNAGGATASCRGHSRAGTLNLAPMLGSPPNILCLHVNKLRAGACKDN